MRPVGSHATYLSGLDLGLDLGLALGFGNRRASLFVNPFALLQLLHSTPRREPTKALLYRDGGLGLVLVRSLAEETHRREYRASLPSASIGLDWPRLASIGLDCGVWPSEEVSSGRERRGGLSERERARNDGEDRLRSFGVLYGGTSSAIDRMEQTSTVAGLQQFYGQ